MTDKFKNKYRIESTRFKVHDYSSPGAYFVTICTKHHECLLGEVVDGKMVLSEIGIIVRDCWIDLTKHYENLRLDQFGIMPNHVHGIMIIIEDNYCDSDVETGLRPVSTKHGISEFIRAFKSFSSRKINQIINSSSQSIWQPRFHDHIIRNETDLNRIRSYITDNPTNWENDEYNIK
jgi:putative transposase